MFHAILQNVRKIFQKVAVKGFPLVSLTIERLKLDCMQLDLRRLHCKYVLAAGRNADGERSIIKIIDIAEHSLLLSLRSTGNKTSLIPQNYQMRGQRSKLQLQKLIYIVNSVGKAKLLCNIPPKFLQKLTSLINIVHRKYA